MPKALVLVKRTHQPTYEDVDSDTTPPPETPPIPSFLLETQPPTHRNASRPIPPFPHSPIPSFRRSVVPSFRRSVVPSFVL
ncbi:hypothetical protein BH09MYX1_BH09MYX1_44590 [soil metagenome]